MFLWLKALSSLPLRRNNMSIMVENEFGVMVHDIFAEWLSVHILGELVNPNPIHNEVAVDIFGLALIGINEGV